jgi:HK97 family phage portal protein
MPTRIAMSDTLALEYGEIWRTQESVRTVVTFLARNIAQLGLPMYKRQGDTDRQRLTEHPLAQLLGQPNPWTTRYRFINALVHDFAIYDTAYLLKMKLDGSTVGAVRLPPRMVEPKGDNWLTPEAFEFRGQKGARTIPADQIVYFRGYNVDEDTGCSPMESLRRTLKEAWSASEMRDQVMRNGARASGYLERPADAPKWSGEAKGRFKLDWQQQYAGSGTEAGGTPILEDGMTFKEASQTAKDLQYIEARKLTREEVAAAYFIPPPMVGILDHASFSNITEQHKMLYQDTLGPWLTMIQDEIALQLIPDFESKPRLLYVEFNLREKLSGSFEERAQSMQTAIGAPWMTVNEGRALDNRPPIDGGDELVRPLNVTQNGDQDPIPADNGPAPAMTPTDKPTSDEDEDEDEQED